MTVNEVNVAPVVGPIGNHTVGERQLLTFTPNVTDDDLPSNTLTYFLDGKPAGASFDSGTGKFIWVPTLSDVGSYNLTLRVNDGMVEVSQSFAITVIDINYPPVFTGIPSINGTRKKGFTLGLIDTGTADDDGDPVTLSYQWAVNGVDIAGSISASLNVTDAMKYKTVSCTITADDGKGGTATYTTNGVKIYKFNWWLFHEAITSKISRP